MLEVSTVLSSADHITSSDCLLSCCLLNFSMFSFSASKRNLSHSATLSSSWFTLTRRHSLLTTHNCLTIRHNKPGPGRKRAVTKPVVKHSPLRLKYKTQHHFMFHVTRPLLIPRKEVSATESNNLPTKENKRSSSARRSLSFLIRDLKVTTVS